MILECLELQSEGLLNSFSEEPATNTGDACIVGKWAQLSGVESLHCMQVVPGDAGVPGVSSWSYLDGWETSFSKVLETVDTIGQDGSL